MKIGIISFAHLHAFDYAAALQSMEGVMIAGIADDNEERGKKYATQFETAYYPDFHELLNTDIDAVVITSENSMHYQHVLAAAEAGKHILCEKPLGVNKEEMEEMIKVCKDHHVILETAFPVRFNVPVKQVKELVDQGQLGKILAIKGTNRGSNPGGWFVEKDKSGGGAVLDHTVHVVDIMRWYTGAEVKEVYAEIGTSMFSDVPIDDSGILTMEFSNGMFATLDCSWSRNKAYPTWGDVTLEIIGTNGTVKVDAFDQKVTMYSNQSGAQWVGWGDDMNAGLLEDFVESIKQGKAPLVSGVDGMKAAEVALGAYQSFMDKKPVKIG